MQRRLEAALALAFQPPGWPQEDFAHPRGEPALLSPDSVSWLVCKNPVVLFVGGVAAVLLELGEPRVRTGVWENTSFRERPLERLQRTALATTLTVYGPRSRAQALITRVARLHQGIEGTTPRGESFRASDPELLDWVHATASFGFLQAHNEYVQPLHAQERDRYFAESVGCAKLYGASGTIDSQAALDALFQRMRERLEPSLAIREFLDILATMPGLPPPLPPILRLLIRAAVQITPVGLRERLQLDAKAALRHRWQWVAVRALARAADRWVLNSNPAVQACRRLGLPDDHLFGERAT